MTDTPKIRSFQTKNEALNAIRAREEAKAALEAAQKFRSDREKLKLPAKREFRATETVTGALIGDAEGNDTANASRHSAH